MICLGLEKDHAKEEHQIKTKDYIVNDSDDYGFGMKRIGIGDMENDTF